MSVSCFSYRILTRLATDVWSFLMLMWTHSANTKLQLDVPSLRTLKYRLKCAQLYTSILSGFWVARKYRASRISFMKTTSLEFNRLLWAVSRMRIQARAVWWLETVRTVRQISALLLMGYIQNLRNASDNSELFLLAERCDERPSQMGISMIFQKSRRFSTQSTDIIQSWELS